MAKEELESCGKTCGLVKRLENENNQLLDVINNQDVKIADLESENRRLNMNVSILKCKKCGAILVVNNNDLWSTNKCPKCGSSEIQNVDDVFDFTEIVENEDND